MNGPNKPKDGTAGSILNNYTIKQTHEDTGGGGTHTITKHTLQNTSYE